MEHLMEQFTILSDSALLDKNFNPSTIEDLMNLFELEAYNSWATMEQTYEAEVLDAETSLKEAEDYLDSAMESAMEEFRKFEVEMDRSAGDELTSLVRTGEAARNLGNSMEKAANMASKKYVEAAVNSAVGTMKKSGGWKGLASSRVHPS